MLRIAAVADILQDLSLPHRDREIFGHAGDWHHPKTVADACAVFRSLTLAINGPIAGVHVGYRCVLVLLECGVVVLEHTDAANLANNCQVASFAILSVRFVGKHSTGESFQGESR